MLHGNDDDDGRTKSELHADGATASCQRRRGRVRVEWGGSHALTLMISPIEENINVTFIHGIGSRHRPRSIMYGEKKLLSLDPGTQTPDHSLDIGVEVDSWTQSTHGILSTETITRSAW
jgi:hypothetical protein